MSHPSQITRIPWHPVTALAEADRGSNGSIAAMDALHLEWQRYLGILTDEQQLRIRQRTLRLLAIETGILERLYEIDWGLTLTLVAEGFTKDVVERAQGRLDERTRATLEAQRDSLLMVQDFVRSNRPLSKSFIRELHAAITRTQHTYSATDSLGRPSEAPLAHGQWKTQPNHVLRRDNSLLEYTPPEHVDAEVESLLSLYSEPDSRPVHPIIEAAWMHHRFVQIHPFSDGNGRVARALVMLVLLKHRYAPLVVDRFHRDDYLDALDSANEGNLGALIRLFVRLEGNALTSELETPQESIGAGVAVEVAHTLAAQLAEARKRHQAGIQREIRPRAIALGALMRHWFESKATELEKTFRKQGLSDSWVTADVELPYETERSFWFRHQIVQSARAAGHYADFGPSTGWCGLRVRVGSLLLRYVGSLHGAGQQGGVLAVTTFGEIEEATASAEGRSTDRELIRTTKDAFRAVHSESLEAIERRRDELDEVLDEGLTVGLVHLFQEAR